jgi:hypothetical protein
MDALRTIDPDNNEANNDSLITRMVSAGWMAGGKATPNELFGALTSFGQQKMEILKAVMITVTPEEALHKRLPVKSIEQAVLVRTELMLKLAPFAEDLQKDSPFDLGVYQTLLMWIMGYCHRAGEEPPPFAQRSK